MAANDRYNLQRFIDAQDPVYLQVCSELRAGRKQSHWMWFIFPQLAGLGSSELARFYAISSLEEAAAYLDHPVLGARLRECTRLVLESGVPVDELFGYPDNVKFRSCMTLFAQVDPGGEFYKRALQQLGLQPDPRTRALLGRH